MTHPDPSPSPSPAPGASAVPGSGAFSRGSLTERTLSGLFRESPVPMLLVEVRSRRVTRVNQALTQLLGFRAEALEGVSLRSLDTSGLPDVEEHLVLALACGDAAPRRRLWRTAQGPAIPVDVSASRLHGDRGTLLVLYARDARHDQAMAADLEQARSQLVLARKHETVARLATGLAREFDTVLDTLQRTGEALRDAAKEDPEQLTALDDLLVSHDKARSLIQELLAFTGQQELAPETVTFNQVLEEAENSLRDGLPQDIGLMVHLSPEPTPVCADPEQLREVVVRLVERAHQALPDGGYVVVATETVDLDEEFVRSHPSSRKGPHAVLSVTDTGVSMDEETRSRIFEPYFDGGGGGGLGLATVYGIVKQSGGTIWATSRPGGGNTFRVYLPRAEE